MKRPQKRRPRRKKKKQIHRNNNASSSAVRREDPADPARAREIRLLYYYCCLVIRKSKNNIVYNMCPTEYFVYDIIGGGRPWYKRKHNTTTEAHLVRRPLPDNENTRKHSRREIFVFDFIVARLTLYVHVYTRFICARADSDRLL